jgi:hypothetical protein
VVLILRGLLRGPRKEAWVQSVWYLEEGAEAFRLVTAYPWRER